MTIRVRRDPLRAFSLIEVLLVLALVGVLMGVVAGNAGAFIGGSNFEPPDRVLKRAALDAVYFSSERKRKTYLSYSSEKVSFLVSDSTGNILSEHPIYTKLDEDILEDQHYRYSSGLSRGHSGALRQIAIRRTDNRRERGPKMN